MRKGYVLVVDDSPRNVQLVGELISKAGYEFSYALNGQEALARMEREVFDCVLLDIMMPDLDGHQVLERLNPIRNKDWFPVIMLTAKGDNQNLLHSFELGAQDYVVKPFNNKEILARIAAHIENARMKRKLKSVHLASRVELKEKNELLQAALDKVEKVSNNQGALLHVLSHGINTPLNQILGFAELCNEAGCQMGHHARRIYEAGQRLHHISERALLYYNLSNHEYQPQKQKVNLKELIREWVDDNRLELPDMELPGTLLPVLSDKGLLKRALREMLDNAKNYKDKFISVRASYLDYGAGIEIAVTNDGHPFTEETLTGFPDIFNTKEGHGLGIGLSLVYQIAELLSGFFAISNSDTGKATQTLIIPWAIADRDELAHFRN